MAKTLRSVGHEDRLSLVEHLDELRSRLMICAITLVVTFALCLWQQDRLLDVLNRPLEKVTTAVGDGPLETSAEALISQRASLQIDINLYTRLARAEESKVQRDALLAAVAADKRLLASLPTEVPKRQPVTLGVTEPFITTLTIALAFAILFSLPLILYQIYGFVLPAFTPQERRTVRPLMLMIPFLFIAGVLFSYFAVLPPAINFLQNFNNESFDILVQARDYYRFELLAMMALGILFQMPVGILVLTRLGVVTPQQLRKNRRYAIVVIAILAMLLPGTDPLTMIISMIPLLLLFEFSVALAAFLEKRRKASGKADESGWSWDDDDDDDDPDDDGDDDEPDDNEPDDDEPDLPEADEEEAFQVAVAESEKRAD